MHPEQQDDEVFITNSRPEDVSLICWTTKRIGGQAFGKDGNPITSLVPVFVKRREIEEAICYRPGVEVYKQLLKQSKVKPKPERIIDLD
jgi:hypothetical protein